MAKAIEDKERESAPAVEAAAKEAQDKKEEIDKAKRMKQEAAAKADQDKKDETKRQRQERATNKAQDKKEEASEAKRKKQEAAAKAAANAAQDAKKPKLEHNSPAKRRLTTKCASAKNIISNTTPEKGQA